MNFNQNYIFSSDKKALFFFKLLIITYVFTDFSRLIFGQTNFSYLFLDFVIILFYLNTKHYFIFLNDKFAKLVFFSFFIFVVYLIFQLFNFNYNSFIVSISGFRTYVLPIFILPIGYYFSQKNLFVKSNIEKYIIFLSLLSIFFAIFQLYTDPKLLSSSLQEFVIPQEHGVHSSDSGDIRLISSFFASSKRFGRFLFVMYLLYFSINQQKGIKVGKIFVILFSIGIFITGSREIFVSFLLLNLFYFLKIFKVKNIKVKNIILLLISLTVLITSFFIFINKSEKKDVFLAMIDFQKSSYDEKGERINALFPLVDIKFSNRNMYFGIGPGKFGQEARLDPEIYSKNDFFSSEFYKSDHNFEEGFNTDAGLSKIFIELGIFGVFIFISCFVLVYLKVIYIFFKINYEPIKFHLSFYIIIWSILFLKSHPVISDVFLSSFLYFSIGYVLSEKKFYEYK